MRQAEAAVAQHGQLAAAHAAKYDSQAAQARAQKGRLADAGHESAADWHAALAEARRKQTSANTVWTVVQGEQEQARKGRLQLEGARKRL